LLVPIPTLLFLFIILYDPAEEAIVYGKGGVVLAIKFMAPVGEVPVIVTVTIAVPTAG
jgi:hypothetical protein